MANNDKNASGAGKNWKNAIAMMCIEVTEDL